MLVLVALLALLMLGSLARWGRPRVVTEISGQLLVPPTSGDGIVAWIERRTDGDHLLVQHGRGGPRELACRSELSGLAVAHDTVLVSGQETKEGPVHLLAIPVGSGKQQRLAPLLAFATQIVAGKDTVYWLSEQPAALPTVPFVVAGGPVAAIWAMQVTADARPTVVALVSASAGVDLLGISSERLYWLKRHGPSTRVFRQEIGADKAELLVSEPGNRRAVVLGDNLAWTASSAEAASPDQYCAVKIGSAQGEGKVAIVADWLRPDAVLLRSGNTLYAQEPEVLWRLGRQRGEQQVIYRSSLGGRNPMVTEGIEYLVVRDHQHTRLVKRGLTGVAKLRVMMGL